MPDTMLLQMNLEERRLITKGGKAIRKFWSIIRLNTFDWVGKGLNEMVYKKCR